MEPANGVTRMQKEEGADAIMEEGFITEKQEPAMMDRQWCEEFLLQINDELRLRTLKERVVLKKFNYYMGDGIIIYDPKRLSQDTAKDDLKKALGFHK